MNEALPTDVNRAGLRACPVKISRITVSERESDGSRRYEIHYDVTNAADQEWAYVVADLQLLNHQGLIIDTTRDETEEVIAVGKTQSFEAYLSVADDLIGPDPLKAEILVTAFGCASIKQDIGVFDVPRTKAAALPLKSTGLGNILKLVAGGILRFPPDDDGDTSIRVETLVQNLTTKSLYKVRILANVVDRNGEEITDAGGYTEIRPGEINMISGGGGCKDGLLQGARVTAAIEGFYPSGTGSAQSTQVSLAGSS